eukprot:7982130-Pyramimonas_sp.AAC.2
MKRVEGNWPLNSPLRSMPEVTAPPALASCTWMPYCPATVDRQPARGQGHPCQVEGADVEDGGDPRKGSAKPGAVYDDPVAIEGSGCGHRGDHHRRHRRSLQRLPEVGGADGGVGLRGERDANRVHARSGQRVRHTVLPGVPGDLRDPGPAGHTGSLAQHRCCEGLGPFGHPIAEAVARRHLQRKVSRPFVSVAAPFAVLRGSVVALRRLCAARFV